MLSGGKAGVPVVVLELPLKPGLTTDMTITRTSVNVIIRSRSLSLALALSRSLARSLSRSLARSRWLSLSLSLARALALSFVYAVLSDCGLLDYQWLESSSVKDVRMHTPKR